MCEQDEYLDKLRELTPKLSAFVPGDVRQSVVEYDAACGTVIGFGLFMREEVAVQRAFLSLGSKMPRHQHDQTEFLIPYTGSLKVTKNGESKIYKPGEVVTFPPNTAHHAEAMEDTYIVAVTVPADQEGYPDA